MMYTLVLCNCSSKHFACFEGKNANEPKRPTTKINMKTNGVTPKWRCLFMNIYATESKSSLPGLLLFFYLFNVARKWIIYSHPQRMSSIFLKAYIITLIVIITMITNVSSSIVSRSHPCCQWLRSNTFILHLWEICHLTVCGPHEASYLTCCVVFSNNAVWSSTWRCCSGLLYTVWSSAEHKLLTDYRIYCVSFL